MKKNEIIQAVACATVPSGSVLVSRDHPTGISVMDATKGGFALVEAKMFADSLEMLTAEMPEEPDAALFELLHASTLKMCSDIRLSMTMPELEEQVVEDYKKYSEKLRQLAKELNITYKEPEDSLE